MDSMSGIKLFDVRWKVKTAGPSPDDNNRTEIFLLGCKKAMDGNPCKGCFNSSTWDASKAEFTHDPKDMVEIAKKYAPNKYISIGGGEPTDQIDNLIELCKGLKEAEFHIFMYTWRELHIALNPIMRSMEFTELARKMKTLLNYVDIIVDGQFIQEERLYQEEAEDGTYNSIGSGNQIVWDIKAHRESMDYELFGYALRDIKSIQLDKDDNLIYNLKESAEIQTILV